METLYYKCDICNYKTNRKYNFLRHQNAMHKTMIQDNRKADNDRETDNRKADNDRKADNVTLHIDKTDRDNVCVKCSKKLSSKQYLKTHLLICKGVSNPLECHLCHKTFYDSSSKCKHIKICKQKAKQQEMQSIEPTQSTQLIEPIQPIQPIQVIEPTQVINNTITLNNNCNNNITYNINLVKFNEEELKIEFDIKHLENNNIVYKLYTINVEDAFRLFYKKLFENKNNQMVIKQNLKHTYSKVHTGRNIWQKMLDDYIYHIIMHFIAETLLLYICNNTKNKADCNYKRLREYGDYMATKGYSYNNTKEIEKSYKNHIKSLKYLFNTFKD